MRRFVAGMKPVDLAVAAYAMFQFDGAKLFAVCAALLGGSFDGAATAFDRISTAIEAMTAEKHKDHFLVKKLVKQAAKENPLRTFAALNPPTTTKKVPLVRALVTGADTELGVFAQSLNLVATVPGYGGGQVEVTGERRSINIFVEKVNRALAVEKPDGMRAVVEQWAEADEGDWRDLSSVEKSGESCVVKLEDETSTDPDFYVTKSCEFPVEILAKAGLGWASISPMGLDNVSSLLDIPAFAGHGDEELKKKVIGSEVPNYSVAKRRFTK